MKVLIIVPAYNEQDNIEKVVRNLTEKCPEYDYLIVNDCSKDDTPEICDREKFNHIDLCCNLGIGGGVPSYSYPAAIGLFTAVVNFVLICITNKISKTLSDTGLW